MASAPCRWSVSLPSCPCRRSRWSRPARPRRGRATGAIRGRVELRRVAAGAERRPNVADLGAPAARDVADRLRSVVYLEIGAARRVRAERAGRAVMDQRNETFVPHVLAITDRHRRSTSRTPTASTTTSSRSRRRGPFDLGRYARRPLEVGPLRSAGHRAGVLRHPLAHERVHPGVQPSVLRDHRRRGPLPHRQRAAGHLQRRRLERRAAPRSRRPVTVADGGVAELDFALR